MGRSIALFSRQAKVGKTSAAVNLAVLLARAGHRTVLLHLDEGWPAKSALEAQEGPVPELVLAAAPSSREAAATWLTRQSELDADFVILDIPNSVPEVEAGLLSVAEEVILLLTTEGRGVMTQLAEALSLVTDTMGDNLELKVRGLLLTFADRKLESFERTLLRVERSFPVDVFNFCIPREDNVVSLGWCVVNEAPTSRSARGYVELAMEVLHHG